MADGPQAECFGEIIRRQRELSESSMRQFATRAFVAQARAVPRSRRRTG